MRRRCSLFALCLAWLFANGAIWNVVQVVAWGKMFSDNLTYLSVGRALEKTFDGSRPCELCAIAEAGQDTAKKQLPAEAALGGSAEKLLLISEIAPAFVLAAPDRAWPGVAFDSGPSRTDPVPVTPPRV